MNKLKFSIVCLLSTFVFLFLLEFSLLVLSNIKYKTFKDTLVKNKNKIENKDIAETLKKPQISDIFKITYKKKFVINQANFRNPIITDSNEHSIILLGCSFAYGMYLPDENTMHYLISKYTNRDTYNYALIAASPRETLYLLRNLNFDKLKNPEYIIYTYISDHRKRLYEDTATIGPLFKISKDKQHLNYYEPFSYFLRKSYIYQTFLEIYANYKYKSKKRESSDLLNLYFSEINNEIKKKFNSNKFVIFAYDTDGNENFEELEKKNIIVIKAKDIIKADIAKEPYIIYNGNYHPNSNAWEIIVPALINELQSKK